MSHNMRRCKHKKNVPLNARRCCIIFNQRSIDADFLLLWIWFFCRPASSLHKLFPSVLSTYNKVFNAQKSNELTVFGLLFEFGYTCSYCNSATLCPYFYYLSRSLIYCRLHANLQAYRIIDFPLRYERIKTVKRLLWYPNDIRLHENI